MTSIPYTDKPASTRARPVMIPWREVARRLAEGEKPSAIAAGLAFDEDRIWRHLRKSLRFRTYLRQAIERQRQLAALLLEGTGRSAMLALGRQPESLDGTLLRCLLDEADRTAGAEAPASSDVSRRIERLGETGAPPPNMAFRRRLAEEWRRMDQQVEAWRAQDAARAGVAPPAPQPPEPRRSEPQRSETNASEAERSETNVNEAKRTETNANEAERSGTNANEAQRAETKRKGVDRTTRLRWSAPPEPRHPPGPRGGRPAS
jgi:hypothetical protein